MSTNIYSNDTNAFVRPQIFYISGFSNLPHSKYYFIFLCCLYTITVLANLLLTLIIYIDHSLHTPKYMAILNLAVADLGESTALFPKIIESLLYNAQEITYEGCLTNIFFVYVCNGTQSFTLFLLAYDRFVAICFPLRYHSIVTNTSMGIMITVCWVFNAGFVIFGASLLNRLSFCKSTMINSFFCDYGVVYRLACNDYRLNSMITILFLVLYLFLPLCLIGLSYTCILLALFKIASWEGRLKALKTCISHLILVSVFYFPVVGTYIASLSTYIHPNARIINMSLAYTVPPVLNPIVYSLNTAEIKDFIRNFFKKIRQRGKAVSNTNS